ncbi:hypothetical protein BURKHO8Y_60116 [Burkholderia sp. 8Y]|nr:hypothetical protein BURKHO8Y_60116 [Burkholderia sp. 8Y]
MSLEVRFHRGLRGRPLVAYQRKQVLLTPSTVYWTAADRQLIIVGPAASRETHTEACGATKEPRQQGAHSYPGWLSRTNGPSKDASRTCHPS